MRAIAVIGDVIRSRRVKDRIALQKKLVDTLGRLGGRMNSAKLAGPAITRGEEFEIVYQSADGLLGDCWDIFGGLYPHRIRIAIGVGSLSTGQAGDSPLTMDGTAFHAARDALPNMKRPTQSPFHLEAYGVNNAFTIENDLLAVLADRTKRWKLTRWKVWEGYQQDRGAAAMAEDLGLKPRAIYKNVHDGQMPRMQRLCEWVERSIDARLRSEL